MKVETTLKELENDGNAVGVKLDLNSNTMIMILRQSLVIVEPWSRLPESRRRQSCRLAKCSDV